MTYYPRIITNLSHIKYNAAVLYSFLKSKGITIFAVTKGTTSHPEIIRAIFSSGISYIGDSRIQNIKKIRPLFLHLQYVLLRLPMLSEIKEVVEYVDISLNSEPEIIKKLGEVAYVKGKRHKIILMVDVGDRREGILPEDLLPFVKEIKNVKGIEIVGIGANFACFGGVLPDKKNLTLLKDLSKDVGNLLGYKLRFVSGGSTSSIYLVEKGLMPEGINNLRVGTGILLGYDDVRNVDLKGTKKDAFLLEAQIIELKEKPSLPYGEIGRDAFGNIPHFEDRGIRKRAILGIGKQDVIFSALHPVDPKIEIVGGSSDHMIVDISDSLHNYKVGDIISFKLDYPAILYLFNSSYVEKKFKEVDR